VIPPVDPDSAHALVSSGLVEGLRVTAAVVGETVVGASVFHDATGGDGGALLALGVAPAWRRRGLAGHLLTAQVEDIRRGSGMLEAAVSAGERDPFDPIDGSMRQSIARRLLLASGFEVERPGRDGLVTAVRRAT
jgi:ribosomal protein S18 acetylase RimI-like enzyme